MQPVLTGLMKLLAASLAASCLHSPPAWSPDGQWLAYTTSTSEVGAPPPGWLIGGAEEPSGESPPRDGAVRRSPAGRRFRIWATELATGASALIEDSSDPVTAPVWGPDGHALCYGRLVVPRATGAGEGQQAATGSLEIVFQEALDRKRVIATLPDIDLNTVEPRAISEIRCAWSPDGQYLAVPMPGPSPSIVILLPEQGRTVRVLHRAERPAWSPDGSRLAFLGPSKERTQGKSLNFMGRDLAAGRTLVELVEPCGAPAWSPDGQSILIAGRRPELSNRDMELMRVLVESRGASRVLAMGQALPGSLSMGLDRQQEQVVFSVDNPRQVSAMIYGEVRTSKVLKRFHPLDVSRRIGAVAVHPDGGVVAVRLQTSEDSALPLLCDLATEELTLLAPDEAARAEWTASLADTARTLLRAALPARPGDAQGPAARPTLLPAPGEIPEQNAVGARLRRIGKVGRNFLDQPPNLLSDVPGEPAPGPTDELRFFFDYLRGDFAASEVDLDAIEARTRTPANRLRLLALCAQVLLARGEPHRARPVVQYLMSAAGDIRRVEETPAGIVTTELDEPGGRHWGRFLAERLEARPAHTVGPQAEDEDAVDLRMPHLLDEIPAGPIDAGPGMPFPPRNRGFVNPPVPGFDPRLALPPAPRPIRIPRPQGEPLLRGQVMPGS